MEILAGTVLKSEDDRRMKTSSAHYLSRNDIAPDQARTQMAAVPLRKIARRSTCAEMRAVDPFGCTVLGGGLELLVKEAQYCWLHPPELLGLVK